MQRSSLGWRASCRTPIFCARSAPGCERTCSSRNGSCFRISRNRLTRPRWSTSDHGSEPRNESDRPGGIHGAGRRDEAPWARGVQGDLAALRDRDLAAGGATGLRTCVRYNMHMREEEVMRATNVGMVPLGYGRFVRADDVVAVVPIEDGRG